MENQQTNKITHCEVCGNQQLVPVLNLGLHPMCDDLIPVGNSQTCREYPIEIMLCETCFTAHQQYQVPKKELFPSTYHYRSRFTADVLNGMKELVASCAQKYGELKHKKVLDIGCNDGSLLDFFREQGAETFGIEPTEAYRDALLKGHVVYGEFLSERSAETFVAKHGQPDYICFTNVFAHIENLAEVIASLNILKGPQTIIVIENHYLGSVLDGSQFDTFYHEHPRTYSYTSFAYIAKSLGLSLQEVEFPARYGGNIRVFLGNAKPTHSSFDPKALSAREAKFPQIFSELQSKIDCWKAKKKQLIQQLVKEYGALAAKAFPGRSAILVKMLGLNENHISAVYEKPGSLKIGHYVPGTRIPIRSDEELFSISAETKSLLNFAWHIPKEIRKYMTEQGYQGTIVDILAADDLQAEPSA